MVTYYFSVKNDVDILDPAIYWEGAKDTIEKIIAANKQEEFVDLIVNAIFPDGTPTMTALNDVLWFDSEFIFDQLGLDEEGNPLGEEDEEDSEEDD